MHYLPCQLNQQKAFHRYLRVYLISADLKLIKTHVIFFCASIKSSSQLGNLDVYLVASLAAVIIFHHVHNFPILFFDSALSFSRWLISTLSGVPASYSRLATWHNNHWKDLPCSSSDRLRTPCDTGR